MELKPCPHCGSRDISIEVVPVPPEFEPYNCKCGECGAKGGKKAMDRSSGSGVFARDPDALLDLIELPLKDSKWFLGYLGVTPSTRSEEAIGEIARAGGDISFLRGEV